MNLRSREHLGALATRNPGWPYLSVTNIPTLDKWQITAFCWVGLADRLPTGVNAHPKIGDLFKPPGGHTRISLVDAFQELFQRGRHDLGRDQGMPPPDNVFERHFPKLRPWPPLAKPFGNGPDLLAVSAKFSLSAGQVVHRHKPNRATSRLTPHQEQVGLDPRTWWECAGWQRDDAFDPVVAHHHWHLGFGFAEQKPLLGTATTARPPGRREPTVCCRNKLSRVRERMGKWP